MTSVEIPHAVAAALPTLSVFDITNEVSRDVARSPYERGIAYVAAAAPCSLVRVSERESGFFCDLEDLLARSKPATALNRYSGLQPFFRWLVDEGEIRESPMARIRRRSMLKGVRPPAPRGCAAWTRRRTRSTAWPRA